MEDKEVHICRLCFEICKNGFEVIDDATRHILNFLPLTLDLNISREPVMCRSCVHNLKSCFAFKTMYLRKVDHMTFKPKEVAVNCRKMCLSECVPDAGIALSSSDMCWFCMEPVNHLEPVKSSVFLRDEEKNATTMLEKYFPELALNVTVDSAACSACFQTVQNQLSFISNCLAVEGRIQEYCIVEGTNNGGQVELSTVLHFTSKNQLLDNIHNLNAVKVEDIEKQMDSEGNVKVEDEDYMEVEEQEFCYVKNEDIKIEMEQVNNNRDDTYQVNGKENLKRPTRKRTSEVPMYRCEKCAYQTKRMRDFSNHILTHRSISEVTVYKCETCAFQTKHERSLKRHKLMHKNSSEVTMYKCEICDFQTKHKNNLHQHTLTHKNLSEVARYKCETCGFLTKYKRTMQVHILTHKSPLEATMYKCEMCEYQTKRAKYLELHVLTHKTTSKVILYKCEVCDFHTKHKRNLPFHMLTHKDQSEVAVYKCDVCVYQGKCKRDLSRHMLSHKSPTEVIMYKCAMCTYQSKCKSYLSRHMLFHKSLADIQTYKCEICTYQGKRKRDLSRHMLVHSDTSEITRYTRRDDLIHGMSV